MINGPAVEVFASDARASSFLAGAAPLVIARKDALDRIPAAWNALPVLAFTQYAALEKMLSGPIDPRYRYVLYDNERWQFTPPDEQRQHARYAKLAAECVRARGLEICPRARGEPGSAASRVRTL